MRCACCARPIEPKETWKGAGNKFYCSEFCADSETPDTGSGPGSLLELHLNRPYERLERLLPHMRRHSQRAMHTRVAARLG